ncbi:hypothetical protein TorRG33x02_076280 [Trema orientale]|uniref:Uncharacterized protein n=1 Tax=Trema orientale TaxID=63057 RepID=A0A2P5FFU5_TREOI|nr:hypothetical protein TorRG33x02_076280 [Trema orientale]
MGNHEVMLATVGHDHEGSILFAVTRKLSLTNSLVVEAKAALLGLRELDPGGSHIVYLKEITKQLYPISMRLTL